MDEDDDFDFEQLFDDQFVLPRKTPKRVRFASSQEKPNSTTPVLSRPVFNIEFDLDQLVSSNTNDRWKNEFLDDLNTAKLKPISRENSNLNDQTIEQDSFWDFIKNVNPELFEKFQKQKTNSNGFFLFRVDSKSFNSV